jgi:two-component system chemotaxis response regulator CheY
MPLNVLVVDDSDVVRTMILRTLQMAQVPVGVAFEAGNGREALDILEDNWVDLVLADLNMPIMDGMEMVERMRTSDELSAIPVVVVSTEGATSRIEELERMGVIAYVRKPFTPEMIRDVVGRVTEAWLDGGYEDIIDKVFLDVLERFALMYGELAEPSSASDPGPDVMLSRMTFSGAVAGALTIAAPQDLCLEMAANILGVETDDENAVEREADALGEVLNMTAGHIVTGIEGDASTNLSPPVITRMDAEDWRLMLAAPGTLLYAVEGHPVLLSLGLRRSRT